MPNKKGKFQKKFTLKKKIIEKFVINDFQDFFEDRPPEKMLLTAVTLIFVRFVYKITAKTLFCCSKKSLRCEQKSKKKLFFLNNERTDFVI